jgi:hypothetical protein
VAPGEKRLIITNLGAECDPGILLWCYRFKTNFNYREDTTMHILDGKAMTATVQELEAMHEQEDDEMAVADIANSSESLSVAVYI